APSTTSDPLGLLTAPPLGANSYGAKSVAGNSSATLYPGNYTSIQISGNAVVTMKPGVYVILGGGFTVSGNASVTGTCVTILTPAVVTTARPMAATSAASP